MAKYAAIPTAPAIMPAPAGEARLGKDADLELADAAAVVVEDDLAPDAEAAAATGAAWMLVSFVQARCTGRSGKIRHGRKRQEGWRGDCGIQDIRRCVFVSV